MSTSIDMPKGQEYLIVGIGRGGSIHAIVWALVRQIVPMKRLP